MFLRTRQGNVDVISGDAALTRESTNALAETLHQCAAQGQPRVVFDLRNVPLIDSAGLEQILAAQDQFEGCGGALKLASPTPLCQEILKITGLATQLEIYGDVRAAVGSFIK